MEPLNEQLPLDAQALRSALNANFHLLNAETAFVDRQTLETYIQRVCDQAINAFNEEIHREIRAIILPPMSPLEVTQEVEEAKTDSKGIPHLTLNDRINAEITYIKEGEGTRWPIKN